MSKLKEKILTHGLPEEAFKHLRVDYFIPGFEFPEIRVKIIKFNINSLDVLITSPDDETINISTCSNFAISEILDILEKYQVSLTHDQTEKLEFALNECIFHYNGIGDGTDLIDYVFYKAIATLRIEKQ